MTTMNDSKSSIAIINNGTVRCLTTNLPTTDLVTALTNSARHAPAEVAHSEQPALNQRRAGFQLHTHAACSVHPDPMLWDAGALALVLA